MSKQVKVKEIWFETTEGEVIRAFNWTGTDAIGIRAARKDAESNGYNVKDVWVENVTFQSK